MISNYSARKEKVTAVNKHFHVKETKKGVKATAALDSWYIIRK
jgi:hypothetical protein